MIFDHKPIQDDHRINAFAPIIGSLPRVLILGTAPSAASLSATQYYGHARNAFWPVMFNYIQPNNDITSHISIDYDAKVSLLKSRHIALWDVLASCSRKGSLDSSVVLETISVNPIEQLIKNTPSIKAILCNGKKSYQWLHRYIINHGDNKLAFDKVVLLDMPSTSPAYAGMPLLKKNAIWHQALNQYL